MRDWFRSLSLRGKVQIVIMTTTTAALLLLFLIQMGLQFVALRQEILNRVTDRTEILRHAVAEALVAGDQEAANAILNRYFRENNIVCGQVYNLKGDLFASVGEALNHDSLHQLRQQQPLSFQHRFFLDHLYVHQPLSIDGNGVGSLIIQASLLDLRMDMLDIMLSWGLMVLIAWLLSLLLSRTFCDVISSPVERLSRAMQTVSEEKNYALRIAEKDRDELGQLTAGFNEMLEQIELRDSELILHRDRLDHMAHHDALTGLPNRLLFNDRLKQAIQRSERSKRPLALVFIDLDRFKNINDTLGHDIGDLVLIEAASRLESCLRKSDTVARLGGDEFVIILEEFESQQNVARIARKIIDELSRECQVMDHTLYVTASLGISFYPDNGTDLTTLKRCADIAMYRAKESGRDNYQFYLPGMGDSARHMLTLESDLRKALEQAEMRLYFQPQVSMKTRRVHGAEALLRWEHPTKGVILPGEFIPLAEETGLIIPLGEWAIRETCRMARVWLDKGLGPICFAVNVSPRQFRQPNLVEVVQAALEAAGLEPHLLELEVTETMLMHDVEEAISKMRKLKALGVQLAIDDFGSGYSSLSYLKHFPINKLKIDRGFIKDLHHDRYDLAIAASVSSLAKVMGLDALAEGVETRAQERALVELGIEWAQGFLYEKPLVSDQFEAFLHQADVHVSKARGELMTFEAAPGSTGVQQGLTARSPLIMVADSKEAYLSQMTVVLNRMGYHVLPINDFDQLLDQLRLQKPHAVFLSGKQQGRSAFRALREDPEGRQLPVVFVCRDGFEDCGGICGELGCTDCISLPMRGEDLCRALALCRLFPGQQRRNLRSVCDQAATLSAAGRFFGVTILNLSEGGAYLGGAESLREGDDVELSFEAGPGKPCHLRGRVLYLKQADGQIPAGAAVKFYNISQDTARLLKARILGLLFDDLIDAKGERVFARS